MKNISRRLFLLSIFFILITLNEIDSQGTFGKDEVLVGDMMVPFTIGITDLSNRLLQNLRDDKGTNVVVSPTALALGLAILQQGATEEAERELSNLLNLNPSQSLEAYSEFLRSHTGQTLNTLAYYSTGVFVDSKYDLYETYKQKIKENFDGKVENVKFTQNMWVIEYINRYISNSTNGQITNFFKPGDFDENTVSIILNSLYFSSTWKSQFLPSQTERGAFFPSETSTTLVHYMTKREKLVFNENPKIGARWVELPFENGQYSMVVILPTERFQLASLIERLTPGHMYRISKTRNEDYVDLSLPKFDIQYNTDLVNTLKNIGVKQIFSQKSDLTKITNQDITVHKVLQASKISINETGCEAAVQNEIQIDLTSTGIIHTGVIEFKVDQPFLAVIVDKINSVPIFTALISNP